jgi:hypothetical protein
MYQILFSLMFVSLWCAMSLLLSVGWLRVARSFRANGPPQGSRFLLQSGWVAGMGYRSCLTIHSSAEGLYLSVLLPFRLGCPPLFIPWVAIHNAKVRRFLWAETVEADIGSPAIATLKLPKQVFKGHIGIA